jgi:putative chitinase
MIESQLLALGIDGKWLEPLLETFEKYDISTPKRQACFIGQAMHESGGFKNLVENLNYSAQGLMRTWASRFPDIDTADKYAHNAEKIANKVYSGRMGNTEDGDGFAYRGRGIFQLTGKENYKNCSDGIGVDLIANPELLQEPRCASLSAGWYWNKRNLNQYADLSPMDIETMTKKINGGTIGLDDRKAKINKVLDILG